MDRDYERNLREKMDRMAAESQARLDRDSEWIGRAWNAPGVPGEDEGPPRPVSRPVNIGCSLIAASFGIWVASHWIRWPFLDQVNEALFWAGAFVLIVIGVPVAIWRKLRGRG